MTIRLFYVKLSDRRRPISGIRHYRVLTELPPPAALTIERVDEEDMEVMLCYLDAAGQEQTHLHRQSVEEAMKQADTEFGIKSREWIVLAGRDH